MELLTADDLAQVLRVSTGVIYHWGLGTKRAPDGFPAPIKLGRLLRWRRADVQAWLEAAPALLPSPLLPPSSSGGRRRHRAPLDVALPAPPAAPAGRKRGRPRRLP